MGTRGAIGFRIDGVDKITYNHFDSYPTGLGAAVIAQVRAVVKENKLGDVIQNIRDLRVVDENADPTSDERSDYRRWSDSGVSTGRDWYSLLRQAQGSLDVLMTGALDVMLDGNSFVTNSLFCEYAYILDIDTEADRFCLEFYTGFNKDPEAAGRYAALGNDKYAGVALVAEYPLDQLLAPDAALIVDDMLRAEGSLEDEVVY